MTERAFAQQVVMQLRELGFQAYWAGGCVRDILLGIEPHDYDVATDSQPKQIRKIFGHANTLAVGAAFGVIIVLSPDRQQQIEVATFRTDANYSDGRHPDSVTFSTPEMDAQRRDFTINGLFFDPVEGNVIDYVGGQDDLRQKLVRAIGDPDARISEDKLRMLRAIRFAARFSLEIEPQTYAAICHHAPETTQVSGERIAMEIRKTLETRLPAWAVSKWADTGLLKVILPEVHQQWTPSCQRIQAMLVAANSQHWLARLAALLWPSVEDGKWAATELSQSLKQRLKLSNEDADALYFAIHSQATIQCARERNWSQVQPLLINPSIRVAIDLLSLRVVLGQSQQATVEWLIQKTQLPAEQLNPIPLVTGQDLIRHGLKPGPNFKQILQQVRDRQLDGKLIDSSQAIEYLREELSS